MTDRYVFRRTRLKTVELVGVIRNQTVCRPGISKKKSKLTCVWGVIGPEAISRNQWPRSSVLVVKVWHGTGPMTTQTFSIGWPCSSTTYPSRRQSPGSGVAVGLGAGGTLTGIEDEIRTNVEGRGAGVPGGVARGRKGVGSGVAVATAATDGDG